MAYLLEALEGITTELPLLGVLRERQLDQIVERDVVVLLKQLLGPLEQTPEVFVSHKDGSVVSPRVAGDDVACDVLPAALVKEFGELIVVDVVVLAELVQDR